MNAEPKIILASASPRRRQLLDLIGLAHLVRPADIEEVRHEDESPADFALRAARDKALAVAAEAAPTRCECFACSPAGPTTFIQP